MATKKPNSRLTSEISQIKCLLGDFKKIKGRCSQLAAGMQIEMPNLTKYANTERSTLLKIELLDLSGLVNLKNDLVKTLTDLFDIERELLYKKQKFDLRMQSSQKHKQDQQKKTDQEANSIDRQVSRNLNFTDSIPEQNENLEYSVVRQKRLFDRNDGSSKILEVPFYHPTKDEAIDGKLDRIAKHVASIKKHMKVNVQDANRKAKGNQHLSDDIEFQNNKILIQQYEAKEQEFEENLAQRLKESVKEFFDQCEVVKEDQQFKFIKISKNTLKKYRSACPKEDPAQLHQNSNEIPLSSDSPIKYLENKIIKEEIQVQIEKDLQQIKAELEKKAQNYKQIIQKLSQAFQKGNQKLKQIHDKRKSIFKQDDDLWNEL